MEMIFESIKKLVIYAKQKKLITPEDETFAINRLLETLGLDHFEEPPEISSEFCLETILAEITDYAAEQGFLDGSSITERDLFDTKLMGLLTPRPSQVITWFRENYTISPQKATDEYYRFSQDTNYIRRDRVARDWKWVTSTPCGDLDITINLSKPEKDPKAIAAAKNAKQTGYPKCALCPENEGYAGRIDAAARQNHRIIPLTVDGANWGFQYSPYSYYPEHCIVFNWQHIPMKINRSVFRKLFDFVRQFPHYFIGSNADLPIVGGSILSHEHFQGGKYQFAMAKAPIETKIVFPSFASVEAGIVRWPMSVIRLRHIETEPLETLAAQILTAWRGYTDEAAMIYSHTDGSEHNTITPIARYQNGKYELDLVLRNNLTTPEHPLGLYHPHEELHHIKKENIGLIEVMGLAVLPARLKEEMMLLARCLTMGKDPRSVSVLKKHADWADKILADHPDLNTETVMPILQEEIGQVFYRVLQDSGVFKFTEEGRAAFLRFTGSVV